MAGRVLRESRFSHDTQKIAYLAPLGRAITISGIVYGKGLKRYIDVTEKSTLSKFHKPIPD